MSDDWPWGTIASVRAAAGRAVEALGAGLDAIDALEARRSEELTLPVLAQVLMDVGADHRRTIAASLQEYEQSVALLRAQVVRALVDEQGVTLSDLASRMGISRQSVTRLYELGARELP